MHSPDPSRCAIHYAADAFEFRRKIMGRMAAGRGFLKGMVRHARGDALWCFTRTKQDFASFSQFASSVLTSKKPVRWIPEHRPELLRECGCLYRPDPGIARPAWQRMLVDPRAYSLCGVTHTICSLAAIESMRELLIAPVEPWDAVVCTTQTARQVIEGMLGAWAEYLATRMNAKAAIRPALPVIPLGVDCDEFPAGDDRQRRRAEMRKQLGLGDGDVAFLFVGRLSFHAKAHPLPMYLGLEAAPKKTGRAVQLLLVGTFHSDAIRQQFLAAARQFCPAVRVHLIDGRRADMASVWSAADVFTSLSDNIQETFGLTPIEAMAAGLPQVVSDWDGYRETVRDGVDGFRIPTYLPAAGSGDDLIRRYLFGQDSYDRYVGYVSQATAVDTEKAAEAYCQLAASPELRLRMGEAARRRAQECFDWSVVIRQYEDLWAELACIRMAAANSPQPETAESRNHGGYLDPFAAFACYTTKQLADETAIELSPRASPARFRELSSMSMCNFAAVVLASREECGTILQSLSKSQRRVRDILDTFPPERSPVIMRTIGWLLKMDLVAVIP